ncbi:uncharacterized protein VTP21DRAFT_9204 [Calcarisporiella thermophila]|uniref:uncharacterized protein n=1 Tax=Calcarisporiella thermophila TaxID=911321 RepID=UPI003741E9D9
MSMDKLINVRSRLCYPSAERTKGPIVENLKLLFDDSFQNVLEVCSGTGQHVAYFASNFPAITFQPSEYDRTFFDSIKTYLPGGPAPIFLDAGDASCWSSLPRKTYDAVIATNLTHVAPFSVTKGLLEGSSEVLRPEGLLIVYGAFKINNSYTAESNRKFDEALKERDPDWGLRDISEVDSIAEQHGLLRTRLWDMPSNNFMAVFKKT